MKSKERIPIVALVPPEDHATLRRIFNGAYQFSFANTLERAVAKLQRRPTPVILYQEGFAGTDWKKVLEVILRMKNRPHFVVVHKFADARFWVEVLNLGGHDVLLKPYEAAEVIRIITYAAESWLAMYRERQG